MIVYALTDGFAHDLRYEKADYALRAGEVKHADGGTLPALDTLHDHAAAQAKEAAEGAERLRLANLHGDALGQDLLDQLSRATPMMINNYVDARVTDLPSAQLMLKKIILVLSLLVR